MCNSNVESTSGGNWELFLLWLIYKRRGNLNCEHLIMRIVINMSNNFIETYRLIFFDDLKNKLNLKKEMPRF